MAPCPWCGRVWATVRSVLVNCTCGYYEGAQRRPKGSGKTASERAVEYRRRQPQATQ